jgi:hypothetical protein
MTGSEDAKQVVITAADSLVDRFSDKVSSCLPRLQDHVLMTIDRMHQELG